MERVAGKVQKGSKSACLGWLVGEGPERLRECLLGEMQKGKDQKGSESACLERDSKEKPASPRECLLGGR